MPIYPQYLEVDPSGFQIIFVVVSIDVCKN